jgi:NADH-quinone oxidoreductase subunit E
LEAHRQFDFRNQHFVGQEGRLIPLLQKAQETEGYLKRERLLEIHRETGIPLASIYGVATFYAQFRMTPVGKNLIRVCHGTACHVAGANDISTGIEETLQIKNGETTKDRLFTLETVSCIGCCSLAPVIMINNDTYAHLTEKQVKKVLKHRHAQCQSNDAKAQPQAPAGDKA